MKKKSNAFGQAQGPSESGVLGVAYSGKLELAAGVKNPCHRNGVVDKSQKTESV
jgi:hypothetical protein